MEYIIALYIYVCAIWWYRSYIFYAKNPHQAKQTYNRTIYVPELVSML